MSDAQPGLAPDDPDPDAEPAFRLEVDGELFEVVYSPTRGSSYGLAERSQRRVRVRVERAETADAR